MLVPMSTYNKGIMANETKRIFSRDKNKSCQHKRGTFERIQKMVGL